MVPSPTTWRAQKWLLVRLFLFLDLCFLRMAVVVESRRIATWYKRTVCMQRCDHWFFFVFFFNACWRCDHFFVFGFSSMQVDGGSTTWYEGSDAMFEQYHGGSRGLVLFKSFVASYLWPRLIFLTGWVVVRCRLPGRLPLGAFHPFPSDPKIFLLVIRTAANSWLVNAERLGIFKWFKDLFN